MFKRERKDKGYSLLEVMIALVVFSSGMISFLMYQAKANTTLFEVESSQMAYSLAVSLAEDISAMTPDEFGLFEAALAKDTHYSDATGDVYNSLRSLLKAGVPSVSPFNSRGESLFGAAEQKYMFYRSIRMSQYDVKTGQTGAFDSTLPQFYLRHVDVMVGWPRRGYGSLKCSDFNSMNNSCNYVNIPVVKFYRPAP
jgi:prepilin-type N-terminal cleavage/methylation domain-containing protein